MVELNSRFEIDAKIVSTSPIEEVEKMLKDTVSGNLAAQISDKLEEMAFIDMNLDEETNKFVVEAELVLCSKNDIITSIQMQSQLMKKYGLESDQIEEILTIATESHGGF